MNKWKIIILLGLLCLIPYIGIPLAICAILCFLIQNQRFTRNGIIKGYKEVGIDLEVIPERKPKFDGQEFAEPEKLV